MKTVIAFLFLFTFQAAHAEQYMVMQYSESVRIVLSKTKCDKAGYRAAAQRIDKQYLRGCWTPEPADKLVRIQWEGGDFSVLDIDRFKPEEVQ
jgi:hypothetical protein